MGKRGNENSQMSKEDWEAAQSRDSGGSGIATGAFDKASSDQMRTRRIFKVGRRFKAAGGGSAGAAAGAQSTSSFRPPPSATLNNNAAPVAAAKNPFATVGLVPGGGGGATASGASTNGAPKNPFANVSFVSKDAKAAPTTTTTKAPVAATTSVPAGLFPSFSNASSKAAAPIGGFGGSMKPTASTTPATSSLTAASKKRRLRKDIRLNRKFIRQICEEKNHNPCSDWSHWLKEYLGFVNQVQEELQPSSSPALASSVSSSSSAGGGLAPMVSSPIPPVAVAPSPVAAAPAPAFSFGTKPSSSKPPPAAAPAAAKPFTGFSFAASANSKPPPTTEVKATSLFPPLPATNGGTAASAIGMSFKTNAAPPPSATTTTTTASPGETNGAASTATTSQSSSSSSSEVMQETNTEEDCIHETKARYFKIIDNAWKGFSAGILRLYRHKTNKKQRRMVLRNEAGRVQLNLGITDGMMFQKEVNKKKKAYVKFLAVQDQSKGVEKFMLQVKPDGLEALHKALEDLAQS